MRNHRTEFGDRISEGARLLWRVMQEQGLSTEDVRREIGASAGLVSNYLYGDKRPGVGYAAKLERAYGVPIASWSEAPRREFRPPAATSADQRAARGGRATRRTTTRSSRSSARRAVS